VGEGRGRAAVVGRWSALAGGAWDLFLSSLCVWCCCCSGGLGLDVAQFCPLEHDGLLGLGGVGVLGAGEVLMEQQPLSPQEIWE